MHARKPTRRRLAGKHRLSTPPARPAASPPSLPTFDDLMLPLLKLLGDGQDHRLQDLIATLEEQLGLSEEQRKALLPSGQQLVFHNRVGWARTYMKKAGLLDSPYRSWVRITARGQEVLRKAPPRIDIAFLEQYEEFRKFRSPRRESSLSGALGPAEDTPEEHLATAYEELRQSILTDLLDQVRKVSPSFFERLVVDLLVRMGYGGSLQEAAKAITGGSGDQGIDGIINEDRLGLDVVYVQAKRWDGSVGSPQVQQFAGALQGKHARKGIFITTSSFTEAAKEYAAKIDSKIVLIDGARLAELMFEYNLGVSVVSRYEVKKVDLDFFAET
ncbi:MAG: restriction endonuclease [Chloroflexi bacterium]|nr:restriction endonuclease [Chloroflexota bacterium]